MDLKGRNFLTLKDFTLEEITYLLDLAADLKEKKKNGVPVDHYHGKNIALIFEKTSTRTRCAFEVAAHDMGIKYLTLYAFSTENWNRPDNEVSALMKLYTGVCASGNPIVILTFFTSDGMEWSTGNKRDSLQSTTAFSFSWVGVPDGSFFITECTHSGK